MTATKLAKNSVTERLIKNICCIVLCPLLYEYKSRRTPIPCNKMLTILIDNSIVPSVEFITKDIHMDNILEHHMKLFIDLHNRLHKKLCIKSNNNISKEVFGLIDVEN